MVVEVSVSVKESASTSTWYEIHQQRAFVSDAPDVFAVFGIAHRSGDFLPLNAGRPEVVNENNCTQITLRFR